MRNCLLVVLSWNYNLKDAKCVLLHWMRSVIPTICTGVSIIISNLDIKAIRLTEITNQIRLFGVWRPLAVGDVIFLVHIETEYVGALSNYRLENK